MKYQNLQNGRFYWEDCINVMKEIPDDVIDLTITSPPYDNLRTYNNSIQWDLNIFKNVAVEISRITKPGGIIVWNVGDETIKGSETGTSFRQALFFKDEYGLNLHDTMIWNKMEFSAVGALQTRYAPVFEYMFVFSKGKLNTFNPIKDRPNKTFGRVNSGTVRNADGSTKKGSMIGIPINEFGQRHNIWEMNGVKSRKDNFHPAPFPIQLVQDHIISWSNENNLVLDPFGGSGTTAIAAINTNRKWICIEKDEEYANKAIERIKNHYTPLKLDPWAQIEANANS